MALAVKMKPRPIHDRIVVKRLDTGDVEHGSIVVPARTQEKPRKRREVALEDALILPVALAMMQYGSIVIPTAAKEKPTEAQARPRRDADPSGRARGDAVHDGVAEIHEKKLSMTVRDMPPLFERGSGTAKTMGGSDMTKFIQICASQNDLFALDAEGDIYQYHFNIKAWVKLIANRESEEGIPSGRAWPQSARPHNGEGRIGEDKDHGVLTATPPD